MTRAAVHEGPASRAADGRASRLAILGLAAIACAGALMVVAATPWGIGATPDSIQYVRTARAFAGTEPSTPLRSAQHAPLYPLVLASGDALGVDPLAAARWLGAAAFGATLVLVGLLARRASPEAPWLAALAAALLLVSPAVLQVHATALSEPLFLLLLVAGLHALASHVEAPRPAWLVAASLAFGLALATRYAGVAAVGAGAASILFWGRGRLGTRLRDTLQLGAIACVPTAVWLASNVATGGAGTNRELAVHPVGVSHAWQALYTASSWLLIPQSSPNVVRFGVVGGLALAALLVGWRRTRVQPVPFVVRTSIVFSIVYGAFLALSISLFDANTPLDDRILLPVFAAGVVVASWLLGAAWPDVRRRPHAVALLALAGLVFVGVQAARGASFVATGRSRGLGFNSLGWQRSPTLRRVRALPAGAVLYSNAPDVVYLHTGRMPASLPRRRFLMTAEENPRFSADLDALGRDLGASCGAVVFLRGLGGQKAMPTEPEVRSRIALRPLAEAGDGVILLAASCPS